MTNTAELHPSKSPVILSLENLLSCAYVLMVKTQSAHWNVTGPHFNSLHALFETQYNALNIFVDEVAERIRALGHRVELGMTDYLDRASIKEHFADHHWQAMVKTLAADNVQIQSVAHAVLQAAEAAGDDVTVDLAVTTIAAHQKAAWMLSATGQA